MIGKTHLIPMLLLIFISQSIVASVIPCSMKSSMDSSMESSMTSSTSQNEIDHSQHHMPMDNSSSDLLSSEMNCQSDCQCPMTSCLSVLVSTSLVLQSANIPRTNFPALHNTEILSRLSSLYRPPIV